MARLEAGGWRCFDPGVEALTEPAGGDGPATGPASKAGALGWLPVPGRAGPGDGLGVHCVPPHSGVLKSALYFDERGEFAGTRVLRLTDEDLTGRPCEADGTWRPLGSAWSCTAGPTG